MGKKKKKWSLSLIIALLALVTSLGQLVFTFPFVLKEFEKVELKVEELGMNVSDNAEYIEIMYSISNTGSNPASKLELNVRGFNNDKFEFYPEIFELKKKGSDQNPLQEFYFQCDKLVPNEKILIRVKSHINVFKQFYQLDTIDLTHARFQSYNRNFQNIMYLKHSKGNVELVNKFRPILNPE